MTKTDLAREVVEAARENPDARAYTNAEIAALLERLSPEAVRDDGWQPIETAPYRETVEVRVGEGMTFRAQLLPDASMNDLDTACDQWQAAVEGEHPPCWSGGACWETNEDEIASLQPTAWRAIRKDAPDA